jgi:hypothetical protein
MLQGNLLPGAHAFYDMWKDESRKSNLKDNTKPSAI